MPRPRQRRGSVPGPEYLRQLAAMGPEAWRGLDSDALQLLAYQQALFLGSGHSEAGTGLGGLYAEVVAHVTARDRMELLDRVTESVETGATSVLALMPFLQHEPDPAVVQSAAVAFAAHMPLEADDPMTGARTIAALVPHADEGAVRAGLVAGLLALGDLRVLPHLRGLWRHLGTEDRAALAEQALPAACAATVEFLLDWLADDGEDDPSVPRAMLERLPRQGGGRVLDLRRRFPAHRDDDTPEIEVVGEWSAAEYGRRMHERLAALPSHLALGAVRHAWGLEGATGTVRA
jgi:hypothetical protein